jgi:hypothetical protein
MTAKRLALATLVVFVLAQVLGIVVHGFVLAADYQPFYGTLLRPLEGAVSWHVALLPVVHLVVAVGVVWLATLLGGASTGARALRIGLLAWLLGPAPMYLLWFAEQPWPGRLPAKQLPLELAAMVVLALVAATLVPAEGARPG